MRRTLSVMLLTGALILAAPGADAARVHQYKSEEKAQKHCPADVIVWGSSRGLFYVKGSPFYGKGPGSWFVCKGEALRAGWRATGDD